MVSKSEFWKGHLAGWHGSGLTQVAYCRLHELSLPSFGYWRRVLRPPVKAAPLPALVPIVIGDSGTVVETVEVRLPNGVQVQLPLGMTAARWLPTLQALLTC